MQRKIESLETRVEVGEEVIDRLCDKVQKHTEGGAGSVGGLEVGRLGAWESISHGLECSYNQTAKDQDR